MGSETPIPYEYGSDLHWLWGWGQRLRSLIDDNDCPPSQHDWMVFQPDSLARDALMRFSVKYPFITKMIGDSLDGAGICFEAFRDDGWASDAESKYEFAEAERILCERIETGVSAIADGEKHAAATKGEIMAETSVTGQSPSALELVEILKGLERHRQKEWERTYSVRTQDGFDSAKTAAYWRHPLFWLCRQLEERLGIERGELHIAASRLITPLGLRGMEPLLKPDGTVDDDDKGQPDRLWMLLKFRELDREGVTARLWQTLLDDFPNVLIDARLAPSAGSTPPAAKQDQGEQNGGNLIERLLAGPEDAELTPRELALLEAHLRNTGVSASAWFGTAGKQGEVEMARNRKLAIIRDFNRKLHDAPATPPTGKTKQADVNDLIDQFRVIPYSYPNGPEKALRGIGILNRLYELGAINGSPLAVVRNELDRWVDLKDHPKPESVFAGKSETEDRDLITWNRIVAHLLPDYTKDGEGELALWQAWNAAFGAIADLIAAANNETPAAKPEQGEGNGRAERVDNATSVDEATTRDKPHVAGTSLERQDSLDFRDHALPLLRSIRKAAADLLAIIRKRRLDRGDLDPQSFKASHAKTEVSCGLLTLRNALGKLPKGFMAFDRFIPPSMTEEEAEALIKRHLDNPDRYSNLTPEQAARAEEAWIKDVRDATKPIPDARPMLDGDEFLDADEAWGLLYKVHSDLLSAGFQRTDTPAPVNVEAEVVDRLQRGIELLDQFEEDWTGSNNWEKALAAVRPVHEAYGKRLDEFKGQTLVGETSERYHTIRDEYLRVVRQVLADYGFREGPPDKFDTPEKILMWLLWQDADGTRTAAEVYLDIRTKAIDGGLNPPLPTGDAAQDILTLRQWCQQQAGGKPEPAAAVEDQGGGKTEAAPPVEEQTATRPATSSPNRSERNDGAGAGRLIVSEGEIVATLRGARVLQLNRQLPQGADDFWFVRCAAIRREDGEPVSEEAWRGLLDAPRGAPTILGQWIPVVIDGQPWQANCYFKGTDWKATSKKVAAVNRAAKKVQRLATSAAVGFGLGSTDMPVDDRAKLWLKALLETIGVEWRETEVGVFLIRDTDNFFAASSRAIMILRGTPAPGAEQPAVSKVTAPGEPSATTTLGLPAEQTTPPQKETINMPAILRAARELEEAIRTYASDDTPNPEWWGIVINRVWHTDRALNPKHLGYGNNRRDEHLSALPILQSGPLTRIRGVVDKVACTFGLDGVIGRQSLDVVLEKAREAAAGANHTAMPIDRRWADELGSAVANLERAGVEAGSEKASHQDVMPAIQATVAPAPHEAATLQGSGRIEKPRSRAWCHDAPPGTHSLFIRGPITGKQKEIEAALDMRWPTIKGKQDAAFYVVDIKKGKYTVYFQHQEQLAEASKRLDEYRTRTNAQKQAGTRKLSKKKRLQ